MRYLKLTLTLPLGKTDEVAERLSLLGFASFEVRDYSDVISEEARRFYDYIDDELLKKTQTLPQIVFYFEEDREGKDALAHLMTVLNTGEFSDMQVSFSKADDAEWRDNWKEFFKPFCVGERLFVIPAWSEEVEIPAGRATVLMDPSAAFGSGTHATTALCLVAAESHVKAGDTVLDVGCGSGILGIAALKLGAGTVDAVDIDPIAVSVAEENYRKNGCPADSFCVFCADVLGGALPPKRYRVVFANLVASLLCEAAQRLWELCDEGGILIASGILSERQAEVERALCEVGFRVTGIQTQDEWSTLCMRRGG